MSTLRISDAPLLPDVDGTEKIPTGGRGDYAISLDQIKGHIFQDIGKELVGLGNVDNTSDLDKPISTAQQAALNLKANKTYVDTNLNLKADKTNIYTRSETSIALGKKADLVNGVIPENQIPSSFNDVLEFTTPNLPIIGESGKIYITTDTNKTWRWATNKYVEISGWNPDSVSKAATIPTYNNATDGVNSVTGVANGAYFNVRSTDEDTMLVEYQNVGGSAVATGKSYLSALGVQLQEKPASTIKDASGKTQQEINDASVVVVDSIADLLALPDGQRKKGLRYLVKGYHTGSDVGGGEFYWDDGSGGEHNGGTVISAGVPWDGSVASFKDFLNGVGDDGTIGAFKLRDTPTALNFGVSETLPDNGYVFYKVFQELNTISIPSGSSPYVIASMPNYAINKTGPVSIFGDGATQIEVTSPESGFIHITSDVSFIATGFALRGAATRTSAAVVSGILCKAPKVCVKGTNISGFNINVYVSSAPGGNPGRFESDIIISGNHIGLAVYKDDTQTNGYGLLGNFTSKRVLVTNNIFTGAERHSVYLSSTDSTNDINCVVDGNIIDAPASINSSIKIHGAATVSNNRIYQKGGFFLINGGLGGDPSHVINITGNEITAENVNVLFGVGSFGHTRIQGNTIKVSGAQSIINTESALIDKRRTLLINDNEVTGAFVAFSREAMSHSLTLLMSGNVIEGYTAGLIYFVPFLDDDDNPIAPTGVALHIENCLIKTDATLRSILVYNTAFDLNGISFRFHNTEVYSSQGFFKDEMTGTLEVNPAATQSPNSNLRPVAEVDPYQSLLPLDEANVQITPLGDMGSATKFWVERVSMGSIRIRVDQAPGTAVRFAWRVTFPGNY